jgi:putative spermidine/putrescine transport system substrate-binding protein
LKGKIAIPSAGFYQASFLIVCAYLNGGSEKNIDPGFQKVKQLLPNVEIIFDTDATARNALAQGEVAVAVGGGDYYGFLWGKKVPAKMIAPKPAPLNFDCLSVVKGGNEALAHEFINFMVQPFAQEKTVVEWKCIPVNKKIAPSPELKDAVPKISDMITPDIAVINKNLPTWIERWNREIVIGRTGGASLP